MAGGWWEDIVTVRLRRSPSLVFPFLPTLSFPVLSSLLPSSDWILSAVTFCPPPIFIQVNQFTDLTHWKFSSLACLQLRDFGWIVEWANFIEALREGVKYFFADFVRKGGGYPLYGQNPQRSIWTLPLRGWHLIFKYWVFLPARNPYLWTNAFGGRLATACWCQRVCSSSCLKLWKCEKVDILEYLILKLSHL